MVTLHHTIPTLSLYDCMCHVIPISQLIMPAIATAVTWLVCISKSRVGMCDYWLKLQFESCILNQHAYHRAVLTAPPT